MTLRPGTPEEAGMSALQVRKVAALSESWVAQGLTPALVVLVARRGVIVLHEAFGRLTPELDSPSLLRDAIFPLASLTKPITATAIMLLVEEGLVGLNRPVADYLPEFAGEGKQEVMVHHLLTHTSGLKDEEVSAHVAKKKEAAEIPPPEETQHRRVHEYLVTVREYLFRRYDAPLWKPPGVEMSYCNYGYELLGEIVRRVSGRSLADFARDRVSQPLGMKDTEYIVSEAMRPRIVRRPPDAPIAAISETREWQETPWGGSGVYSTAMDMATFGQMFLNRGVYGDIRILSPTSVAEMTRNQIPGISARRGGEFFPEASWGLGWDIHENKKAVHYDGTLNSPSAFAHGGGSGVYLWVDPVYDLVGAWFAIALELNPYGRPKWGHDLFVNAVTAAVVEV